MRGLGNHDELTLNNLVARVRAEYATVAQQEYDPAHTALQSRTTYVRIDDNNTRSVDDRAHRLLTAFSRFTGDKSMEGV